jgi:hypothetical protein
MGDRHGSRGIRTNVLGTTKASVVLGDACYFDCATFAADPLCPMARYSRPYRRSSTISSWAAGYWHHLWVLQADREGDGESLIELHMCTTTFAASAFVAPNNATTAKDLANKGLKLYCGSSQSSRILKSMRNSAVVGAVRGGIAGFVTGEIFGGEVTFGTSGIAGAALGGFIQGTIGATTGVFTGFASAEACQAIGAYNSN